jgi:hypothetical protein
MFAIRDDQAAQDALTSEWRAYFQGLTSSWRRLEAYAGAPRPVGPVVPSLARFRQRPMPSSRTRPWARGTT